MLDSVLNIFRLKPDYDLNIMEPRQTLSTITSKCLTGMDGVLEQAKPDLSCPRGHLHHLRRGPWPPSTTKCRWAMWRPAYGPTISGPPIPRR